MAPGRPKESPGEAQEATGCLSEALGRAKEAPGGGAYRSGARLRTAAALGETDSPRRLEKKEGGVLCRCFVPA